MKTITLLLILALFSGVMANAQTSVTVSGTVEDPSGAVIPGATVTLACKATGQAMAANYLAVEKHSLKDPA